MNSACFGCFGRFRDRFWVGYRAGGQSSGHFRLRIGDFVNLRLMTLLPEKSIKTSKRAEVRPHTPESIPKSSKKAIKSRSAEHQWKNWKKPKFIEKAWNTYTSCFFIFFWHSIEVPIWQINTWVDALIQLKINSL